MFPAFTKHSVNLTTGSNHGTCLGVTPTDSTWESALPSVLGGRCMAHVMGAAERTGVVVLWNLDHEARDGKSSGKPWLSQCPFYDKRYVRLQVKNYSHG